MTKQLLWAIAAGLLVASSAAAGDWTQFRGAASNSAVEGEAPPTTFKPQADGSGEHVAWRADLVGRGPASPIVVKGHVIVVSSDGRLDSRLHVQSFSADSGKLEWHRQYWATGRTFSHPQTCNAAPTPASDGERIFVFTSSNDLACLDLAGNLLWYRGLAYDWPKAGNDVGMSSSPVVSGNTVIVLSENQGDSFAAGLDTATGETRWRIARVAYANWTSPVIVRGAKPDADIVVFQSPSGITGVEAQTGRELWKDDRACDGISSCTPVGERLFVPSKGLTAFDATATGLTEAWNAPKLNPGAASPIVHHGRVYVANRAGVVTCGSAGTGEVLWQLRLEGPFWGTPAVAGDYMFPVTFKGLVQVVRLGSDKGELVHTADFGEPLQASPAIVDGALYVRGDKHLWKVK